MTTVSEVGALDGAELTNVEETREGADERSENEFAEEAVRTLLLLAMDCVCVLHSDVTGFCRIVTYLLLEVVLIGV